MSGLLRICTAGSVDDGKSTLIGRLLYDSRSVYEDQVSSVEKASKNRDGRPDRLLALHRRPEGRARAGHHDRRRVPLLRDGAAQVHPRRHAGPRAVHAQHGDRRVDRRRRDPARRRAQRRPRRSRGATRGSRGCSASPTSSLAVNKMDLVDFDRGVFDDIVRRLRGDPARTRTLHPIPISALHGDNVITRSERTPWFDGASLLEYLETVEVDQQTRRRSRSGSRCSSSLRPDQDFRGYAGQIVSGTMRVGDAVTVWPSGRTARVERIVTWDGDLEVAHRADVGDARRSRTRSTSAAATCSADPATPSQRRPAVRGRGRLDGRAAARSGARLPAEARHAHGDRRGRPRAGAQSDRHGHGHDARPLIFDRYTDNRVTGSFILIDPATNFTAGAGMIIDAVRERPDGGAPAERGRAAGADCARAAGSDAEAVDAVQRALEEILK